MTTRKQASWPVSRGLFGRFSGWLGDRRTDRERLARAFSLYHGVVERARKPDFYAQWGVPDTRDGRLEMIFAQTALLMRRLRAEGEAGRDLAQAVFDVLFADVDRNIREQGVGDLSVGKHVKRAAQTFLARAQALDAGLDAGDRLAIARTLERNIFNHAAEDGTGEGPEPGPGMRALAGHLQAEADRLAAFPGERLLAGECGLDDTASGHGAA